MTVAELIVLLGEMDPNLPVQVKTYGCGTDSWNDVDETMINDMVNGDGERICEIAADFN